jgi:pantothenate kinase-related protein Tda10
MHITKNYLADQGAISKNTKVPLIMGIWGPKGCGKTFQVRQQQQQQAHDSCRDSLFFSYHGALQLLQVCGSSSMSSGTAPCAC